jgi:hypothetical protein
MIFSKPALTVPAIAGISEECVIRYRHLRASIAGATKAALALPVIACGN